MPKNVISVSKTEYSQAKGKSYYSYRYRSRRKKPSTKDVPLPIKQYVNNAIHSNLENKQYTTEVAKTMSGFSNTVNFQSGNIFQLTPSNATNSLYTIPQGLGEGARVGNNINIVSAKIRFVLYPQLYNATSNATPKNLDIIMYIFSTKKSVLGNTVLDAFNVLNSTFYANGSGSIGLLNNLYDLVSFPNNEIVRLHKKKIFKLGPSNAQLQTGVNAGWSNNDYKYNIIRTINIKKYLPKKITFNDTDNNSTSNQVFAVFHPINADGTTIPSTNFPCSIFFGIDISFEDA